MPAKRSPRRDPERPTRQLAPAGRVLVTMGVCLLLWTLVAAPGLTRSAESSDLGLRRSASLAVLSPIARVSALLSFDRVGRSVESALGRDGGGEGDDLISIDPVGPRPRRTTAGPRTGAGKSTWTVRAPNASDPLTVLTVGDSLGIDLALGMDRLLSGQKGFVSRYDARVSTGLTRPDYFDWPAQLQRDLAQVRPDIVVAMFGANDTQALWDGSGFIPFGTPPWKPAYRGRVGRVMDMIRETGVPVVWVGMPPMAKEGFSRNAAFLNTVYQFAASKRRGVVYVDAWSLFSNRRGEYAAYLPDASGRQELVRRGDGVHLTSVGFDRLAEAVYDQMSSLWQPP